MANRKRIALLLAQADEYYQAQFVEGFIGKAFEQGIDWHSVPAYLIGMAVAILSSIFSIRILRMLGKKGKFGGFAYYCWVVGVLSIILYLIF